MYLISHDRRFLEIPNPLMLNIRQLFETDFRGMTLEPVDVADLERTRLRSIDAVTRNLTHEDRLFLVAFKEENPDWKHLSVPHIKDLPAVKWFWSRNQL